MNVEEGLLFYFHRHCSLQGSADCQGPIMTKMHTYGQIAHKLTKGKLRSHLQSSVVYDTPYCQQLTKGY